eukprot:378222_1
MSQMLLLYITLFTIYKSFGQNVIWKEVTERINITEELLPYFNNTGEQYTREICNVLPWKNLNAIIDRNKYNYWYSYYAHWAYTVEINESYHERWIIDSTNVDIFTPSLTQFDKNDIPHQIEASQLTPHTPLAQEGIYTCSQMDNGENDGNIAYCYVKYGAEQNVNNVKTFCCKIYYNKLNKWSDEIKIMDRSGLLLFEIICFSDNFAFVYTMPSNQYPKYLISYYLIDFDNGNIIINNNPLFESATQLLNWFKVAQSNNNLLFYMKICNTGKACDVLLKIGYYYHSIVNPNHHYKIEMTETEYIINNTSIQQTTIPLNYNDNGNIMWIVPVTKNMYNSALIEIYLFDINLNKMNQIQHVVQGYKISFDVISVQMLNNNNDDMYFSIVSYNNEK